MKGLPRAAIWLVTICAGVALAWVIRPALLVIILAMLYAFLTWPLTRMLMARLPRPFAAMLANVGVAVLVIVLLAALGPLIYVQASSLANQLPEAFGAMLRTAPILLRTEFAQIGEKVDGNIFTWLREALLTSMGALRSVTGVIGAAILIPVLATYFQIDLPRYERATHAIIAPRDRAIVREAIAELSSAIGGFIRAQLLVSAIVGGLVYAVLLATHVHFAATIAFLTAIADLVPYLGGVVAFVPSVLLAIAFGGVARGVIVTLLLIAVFELEAQVLQPQIVGSRTSLPPSVVIVSLIIGGTLLGAIGLFLAVPIASAIRIIARHSLRSPGDATPAVESGTSVVIATGGGVDG